MLTVIGLVIFTVELLHLSATFEAEPDRSIGGSALSDEFAILVANL